VFVVGKGKKPWISLPKGNGIYLSPAEAKLEHEKRAEKKKKH